jgi:ArsR family transcriptional regulator, arsenate/arsenite/antimonite-responsive transcriptional repressor / arsenate reductase (thioredoxin)
VNVQAQPPALIKLLADDMRWQIVTALARSDRRGRELVQLLRRPQNLVSYHLRQLLKHKLVSERRSAADGRDVYFSLRLDALRQLYQESGQALHPGLADIVPNADSRLAAAGLPPVRALFLCTHNSARSQMAEAILRHLSRGQVDVHSAGNEPSEIHPLARQAMRERGIPMEGQRAKHLSEFEGQRFDYIVTVCDLAREACPVFPGDPEQIHWSFADPVAVAGLDARERAFSRTATELTTRINYLLLLINRKRAEGPRP